VVEIKRSGIFILLIILVCKSASAIDVDLTSRNITHEEWGVYHTFWYDNKIYFAGYASGSISKQDITTINITSNAGQLHSVLKDENIMKTYYLSDKIPLQDSYDLLINDIDFNSKQVIITLLKNGSEVERKIIAEGENYIYVKNVGNVSDLPLLAVHLQKIMTGPIIFIQGIFQISEEYIYLNPSQTPTPTPTVTPTKLMIETPEKTIEHRMITIRVTYRDWPISGADVKYDTYLVGETGSNGTIEFVLETSGVHTITASKPGYNNGSKIIAVVTPAPTQTPKVTSIPSTSNASPQPVETLNDNQEIDANISPLIVERVNNENQSEKQTDKLYTANYPAFIVTLMVIVIVYFLRKRF
jgi:hypothetical protein